MNKLESYRIYPVLLLLLLSAATTFAQENVDNSAFRDERENEYLSVDSSPENDDWRRPDWHLTFLRQTLTRADSAAQPEIEWPSIVVTEHKVDESSDDVTASDSSATEGGCLHSGDSGTRPTCFFSSQVEEFVVPKYFVASAGGEKDGSKPDRFHWKAAIIESIAIQGFQHGYALAFQEKTRRALKGPFFRDYINSLKGLAGWDDGNRFFTNYVAHPAQGGMTGFIFVQNLDRAKRQKFGESKQYWVDRVKAFAWSAAWSINWELGPISQSSIGNLGLKGGMAYVDLVITPTVGTFWLVSEEAIDRFIIRHAENKNFLFKIALRMFLNPMRSVANALRLKEPWYRDRPFGH